ncbi:MAG: hypothetical protein UY00_C0059G0001, partial [Candidatus Wolfebacteria bacterium GW2011_GWA1_47_6]
MIKQIAGDELRMGRMVPSACGLLGCDLLLFRSATQNACNLVGVDRLVAVLHDSILDRLEHAELIVDIELGKLACNAGAKLVLHDKLLDLLVQIKERHKVGDGSGFVPELYASRVLIEVEPLLKLEDGERPFDNRELFSAGVCNGARTIDLVIAHGGFDKCRKTAQSGSGKECG